MAFCKVNMVEKFSYILNISRIPSAVFNANKWANVYLNHYDDPNLKVELQRICQMQAKHIHIPLPKLSVWTSFECKSLTDLAIKYCLPIAYPLPHEISTNYQIILSGKRIRERNAFERTARGTYSIPLIYHINNKPTPHSPDHFDILLCYFPEPYLHTFALIPVKILVSKSLLKTDNHPGNQTISLHIDEPRLKGPMRTNEWVKEYLFRFDDDQAYGQN